MEATTPKEFFEKVLPARFDASKAAGVDAVVQSKYFLLVPQWE